MIALEAPHLVEGGVKQAYRTYSASQAQLGRWSVSVAARIRISNLQNLNVNVSR